MDQSGNIGGLNNATFCGLGEVVLHNFKNHAGQLVSNRERSDAAFRAFTQKTKKLFIQLHTISKRSEMEGILSQGTSETLWNLVEPYNRLAEGVLNGGFRKQEDFLEKIFNLISYQYNHRGLMFNIAFGEHLALADNNTPLTPVEKALKKVIPLIVPRELLLDGELHWREDKNGGKELVVLHKGRIFSTELLIQPGCLAPETVDRLLES